MILSQGFDTPEEIFRHFKNRDPKAAHKMYYLTSPDLRKYVKKHCSFDKEAVEDILQDCYLILMKQVDDINDFGHLVKFLWITARNKISEHRRRKATGRTVAMEEEHTPDGADEVEEWITDRLDDVRVRQLALILGAIDELAPQRREVFLRRYLDDKSNDEIAAELGISVHTVRKHLGLARKELQNRLSRDLFRLMILLLFNLYTEATPYTGETGIKIQKKIPFGLLKNSVSVIMKYTADDPER